MTSDNSDATMESGRIVNTTFVRPACTPSTQETAACSRPSTKLQEHQFPPTDLGVFDASYILDPTLNSAGQQRPLESAGDRAEGSILQRPTISHFHSFSGAQARASSARDSIENTRMSLPPCEDKKRPGTRGSTTQVNDQELRRLFQENRHRALQDIASTVLAHERGPKSEKTKQIFAMLWLHSLCRRSKTSVPRNRVYAQYAQRCGTERVPLLNPASFGKLVRIIFPDITTRRLGMRGESKYHYVDLELVGQDNNLNEPAQRSVCQELNASAESAQFVGEVAEFPAPIIQQNRDLPFERRQTEELEARGHIFLDKVFTGIHRQSSRPNMLSRPLKFPSSVNSHFPIEAPIDLPDIGPFLPAGTDHDAAAALKALYRSHCISVIDCMRFCKEKLFWHHFTAFHGTLTVPVQKLFSHPMLAPWIQKCDWLMYQRMIEFVSPLALQVMPEVVTNTFQSISDNLGCHILTVFGNQPEHVRDSKHGPAVVFASLLGRLLRVNAASHAAAHILGNDETRNQMWRDWVLHVKPAVVAETCLPGVGYSRCVQILTNNIRQLLSPIMQNDPVGAQQIFLNAAADHSTRESYNNIEFEDTSAGSVLDRWIAFLAELPARFPNANARTLLHCVSDVGTAALRDITMATAVSFGQWTVTKVWVDEMLQWMAEKGGFLDCGPEAIEMRPIRKRPVGSIDSQSEEVYKKNRVSEPSNSTQVASLKHGLETDSGDAHRNSRRRLSTDSAATTEFPTFNSGGQQEKPDDDGPVSETGRRSPTVPNHTLTQPAGQTSNFPSNSHDDSGIGLEIDFSVSQSPSKIVDYGRFIAAAGADHTDVIVC